MSTRHIGLSLGADLCWPQFYEDILAEMAPVVEIDGETVDFEVERITIEPFDLDQPVKYDVVLDRLTPWYHTSREWIKKAVVKDDLYVLNNPFTLQAMQKHTSYAALMRLGAEIPETWLLPPKEYGRTDPLEADLDVTLDRYAQMFDLRGLGEHIGYPLFMKPYDGGAWVGVTKIDDGDALVAAYEASGSRIMHLQKAVLPVRPVRALPRRRPPGQHHQVRPGRPAPRPLQGGVQLRRRGRVGAPGRPHPDHQHLLRVGLQLVRGAPPGRRPSTRSTSPTPTPTAR